MTIAAFIVFSLSANAQTNNDDVVSSKTGINQASAANLEIGIRPVLNFKNEFLKINSPEPGNDKTDFLQKSRNQKTTAWLLVGGGGAVLITGLIVSVANTTHDIVDVATLQGQGRNTNTGAILIVAGGVTALGSIPLFLASSRNKRKANLSVSKQSTGYGLPNGKAKSITGVSLSIPLGK